MKKSAILICSSAVLISCARSQEANMFLGNPTHQAIFSGVKNDLFDLKTWKFNAGSPVRSTPLIVGNSVFFGTTAGDFFSVHKKSGEVQWKRAFASAINSSAAYSKGKVFFADNEQKLFAVSESNGHVLWSFAFGPKLKYPWRFDYYYSSPVLYKDWLIIGGDDGWLYALHQSDGKLVWKYNANSVIRSSATVYQNMVLFGDMEGRFHSLDVNTGKEVWIYKTDGDTLKNENWGFDRKAILSSAVVSNHKLYFGSRAGFLYCLNVANGSLVWKVDHKISWVISTPSIQDSILVTGTSDGRFVQAIDLPSGKQIWRTRTAAVVWSSPIIVKGIVYAADFDGQLYCLDLKTGKKISQFLAGDRIMSSPVYNKESIYFGSDDGYMYALKGRTKTTTSDSIRRYVFYDSRSKNYYQSGADFYIKEYLNLCGFRTIGVDTLENRLSARANRSVIVFCSNYFPDSITNGNDHSLLRKFLDEGGRIIIMGTNPLAYKLDDVTKQPNGFNVPKADSVLNIHYGFNDTRAFEGMFTSFSTEEGKRFGLSEWWTSMLFCDADQVDVVLGKNENGMVSAFAKRYKNGGMFIQIFMHPRTPQNLDSIVKLAEEDF